MALAGGAVLAIWNGIATESEDEFLRWHVNEHIPERIGVTGFLRARRYVALDGFPKYFNFYEVTGTQDLHSPEYLARLNAPSEWTRHVVQHFRDTSRTICDVAGSLGMGDGSHVATLRMTTTLSPKAFSDGVLAGAAGWFLPGDGIVAVHLLQGEPDMSGEATAEKSLRDRPDETAAWILLVEAVGPEPLRRFLDEQVDGFLGEARAKCPAAGRGIYALQYGLSRAQRENAL